MSWITALRRRPAAGYAVVLLGLVTIGVGYGALTTSGSPASAATPGTVSPQTIAQGRALFTVSCATSVMATVAPHWSTTACTTDVVSAWAAGGVPSVIVVVGRFKRS